MLSATLILALLHVSPVESDTTFRDILFPSAGYIQSMDSLGWLTFRNDDGLELTVIPDDSSVASFVANHASHHIELLLSRNAHDLGSRQIFYAYSGRSYTNGDDFYKWVSDEEKNPAKRSAHLRKLEKALKNARVKQR